MFCFGLVWFGLVFVVVVVLVCVVFVCVLLFFVFVFVFVLFVCLFVVVVLLLCLFPCFGSLFRDVVVFALFPSQERGKKGAGVGEGAFGHAHSTVSSKFRPFRFTDAASKLDVSFILTRLDYCNFLLAGLPDNKQNKLQRINKSCRVNSHPYAQACECNVTASDTPLASS